MTAAELRARIATLEVEEHANLQRIEAVPDDSPLSQFSDRLNRLEQRGIALAAQRELLEAQLPQAELAERVDRLEAQLAALGGAPV